MHEPVGQGSTADCGGRSRESRLPDTGAVSIARDEVREFEVEQRARAG
jgi:hypothetical protein